MFTHHKSQTHISRESGLSHSLTKYELLVDMSDSQNSEQDHLGFLVLVFSVL